MVSRAVQSKSLLNGLQWLWPWHCIHNNAFSGGTNRERESLPCVAIRKGHVSGCEYCSFPSSGCLHLSAEVSFKCSVECVYSSCLETGLQLHSLYHSYQLTAGLGVWNLYLFHCCSWPVSGKVWCTRGDTQQEVLKAAVLTCNTEGFYIQTHTVESLHVQILSSILCVTPSWDIIYAVSLWSDQQDTQVAFKVKKKQRQVPLIIVFSLSFEMNLEFISLQSLQWKTRH